MMGAVCVEYLFLQEKWMLDFEWTKLQELHYRLFGCDFEDTHDAMADITATKKCFFEMRKRGLI